jgi:hypothetical protein
MSGSGEMAVRRFERDVKSGDRECECIRGEGLRLASVLDRDSTADNTCNMKSMISKRNRTGDQYKT